MIRRGPERQLGAAPGFAEIRNYFDFRAIRIGGWVTAQEQRQRARDFFIALLDLQQILELPSFALSLRGQLSLHYGTGGRPGVCAHYQPASRTLALAKNAGLGSLAHEWWHALDHYLAERSFNTAVGSRFASTAWLADFPLRRHPVAEALGELFQRLFLNADGKGPSELVHRSVALDRSLGSYYWSQPEEIAARAFETFIDGAQIHNSLLTDHRDIARNRHGIYPTADERKQLDRAFRGYFSQLAMALQRTT